MKFGVLLVAATSCLVADAWPAFGPVFYHARESYARSLDDTQWDPEEWNWLSLYGIPWSWGRSTIAGRTTPDWMYVGQLAEVSTDVARVAVSCETNNGGVGSTGISLQFEAQRSDPLQLAVNFSGLGEATRWARVWAIDLTTSTVLFDQVHDRLHYWKEWMPSVNESHRYEIGALITHDSLRYLEYPYGWYSFSAVDITVTPEPASACALLVGVHILGSRRRNAKRTRRV